MTPDQLKEWIWSRCKSDGDCMLWTGATDRFGVPRMRRPGSRSVESARRVLMECMGVDIAGKMATTTCEHPGCLAEDHCLALTRKQLQKRSGKKLPGNMVRSARIAAVRRLTATLDMDKVREMRESGLTTREAAAQYGVTQSTACKAMRGDHWKEYGANPFHGLGGRS